MSDYCFTQQDFLSGASENGLELSTLDFTEFNLNCLSQTGFGEDTSNFPDFNSNEFALFNLENVPEDRFWNEAFGVPDRTISAPQSQQTVTVEDQQNVANTLTEEESAQFDSLMGSNWSSLAEIEPQLYQPVAPATADQIAQIQELIQSLSSSSALSTVAQAVASGPQPSQFSVPVFAPASAIPAQSSSAPQEYPPFNVWDPRNAKFPPPPQSATITPPSPLAPVNQYPTRSSKVKSKQQLQPIPPIGKTPRQHHPKDDSVSITTTFTCQWIASPASDPCGKKLISREQMMNHINKEHPRVETKTHRWCLWDGCEYSGDTPLSTSSSFNNHLKNVHLKVGESSVRGRKPGRFKPYPTGSH